MCIHDETDRQREPKNVKDYFPQYIHKLTYKIRFYVLVILYASWLIALLHRRYVSEPFFHLVQK